uniref:Uncharacterized protein n=1 Tax=Arundo donax TaxID=35708 RepID=A0A0A9D5Q6_ARUDO
MLLGKYYGWCENHSLMSCRYNCEYSTHCNFRFAKTHISTDQSIHRCFPFRQVFLNIYKSLPSELRHLPSISSLLRTFSPVYNST